MVFGSEDLALDDADLLAWTVMFGEMEGSKFDWSRGAWKEPGDK